MTGGPDEKNPIEESNRGEDPKPWWPPEAVDESSWTWGADEMVEEMTACPRCSLNDLCDYHRGMVTGYSKGIADRERVRTHDD